MKKYHVYAIGNAMVDVDFEVDNHVIERLNVEKGVMTLIDEATHYRLLEELQNVPHVKACGGSAANTIITLQQFGAKTFYSCRVGNDEAGDFYYRDLMLNGIHTNLAEGVRSGVTGKCVVLVTPDADRTMNTFLGATAEFSKTELSEKDLKESELLYIEGYLVAMPCALEAAITAREMAEAYHVKTAMSLSDPNMVTYFKEGLCAMIGHKIDILFCNEAEALIFCETDKLTEAQEKLKQFSKTFIITRGSEGALIYDGQRFLNIPSYKVVVVDTVGAGDIFAGAFLYGITQGCSYSQAGKLASLAASKVVAKFGPRLTHQEVRDVQVAVVHRPVYEYMG